MFFFVCAYVYICMFAEHRLHLRVGLITGPLRGPWGDICSCTGVRGLCGRLNKYYMNHMRWIYM